MWQTSRGAAILQAYGYDYFIMAQSKCMLCLLVSGINFSCMSWFAGHHQPKECIGFGLGASVMLPHLILQPGFSLFKEIATLFIYALVITRKFWHSTVFSLCPRSGVSSLDYGLLSKAGSDARVCRQWGMTVRDSAVHR